MKRPAVFGFASLLVVMGLSIAACSSSNATPAAGSCQPVGYKACPNDVATAQDDLDDCTKAKADAMCGADYTSLLVCAANNVECGPDGKSDATKFASNCSAVGDTYGMCLAGGGTSGDAGFD